MRKIHYFFCLILIITLAGLSVYVTASQMMSIQVKKGQIRASPSFLGKIVAEWSYGDRITVMEEKNDWYYISKEGQKTKGWAHRSALIAKEIVLNPDDQDVQVAADNDELVLAGKGFNQQIEDAYRQSHPEVGYEVVNKMEQMTVSQKQIHNFIKTGALSPQKGAK